MIESRIVIWFEELWFDLDKKAVLSQRWPRDARYISRPWAVAEIWPFEIFSKMAAAATLDLFEL